MTNELLRERIEELVWSAFSAGEFIGHPRVSERVRNRTHAEVFEELNELLSELELI